ISFRAPARRSPDSFGLDVLSYILGHGKSSRLYQQLVEKEKVCSSISIDNEARKDHNLFQIYLELLPDKDPAKVEASVLSLIEKAKTEVPTEGELERAKNQIQSTF